MIGCRFFKGQHITGKGGWSVAYIVLERGLGERVKGGK